MRSRRSVISLSRDWMILLMSLMRGPKFANSLSSLDFSCMTQMKQVLKQQLPQKLWAGKRHWGVARLYLHVEGQVAGFCLFKITLRVLESHLKTVGLRLHLPQFSLLPLGFHLLLQRKTSRNGCEFSSIGNLYKCRQSIQIQKQLTFRVIQGIQMSLRLNPLWFWSYLLLSYQDTSTSILEVFVI